MINLEFARVNYAGVLLSFDSLLSNRVPSKTLATLASACWGLMLSSENHLPITWRIWRMPSSALISGVTVNISKNVPL